MNAKVTPSDNAFKIFVQRLAPPRTQRDAAVRSNNALRSRLQNDHYFSRFIIDSFLTGSYARGTTIRPIKDVDIVLQIQEGWLSNEPAAAMESLRKKLAFWYPGWRTSRRRRAVKVELSDVNLDVVLAIETRGTGHPLLIPDRDADAWLETHPRLQLALIRELITATSGNYTRLVRLFKGWAFSRVPDSARPPSFVLECLAYEAIAADPNAFVGSLPNVFAKLLASIENRKQWRNVLFSWEQTVVRDPALPKPNVAERWDSTEVRRFRESLRLALRRSSEALDARYDDTEIRRWRTLFGDRFPGVSAVLC